MGIVFPEQLNYNLMVAPSGCLLRDPSYLGTYSGAYSGTYSGAGIVFASEHHILAGHQVRKTKDGRSSDIISGFGGRRWREDRRPIETAIRETLEELFEFKNIDFNFIHRVEALISPKRVINNEGFLIFVCDFSDLEKILGLVNSFRLISPLYDHPPRNIADLIFNRKNIAKQEIRELSLLPIIDEIAIHPEFVKDIRCLLH